MDRDPATISREVRRNADPRTGAYHPNRAQRRAAARRARSKDGKLGRDVDLREFVQRRLDQRWSREQINRALREEFPEQLGMRTAPETIYQALYRPDRGGLRRETARRLRTGRVCRRRRRQPAQRATRFVDPGLLIKQRTPQASDRAVPGHWEGDLIVGKGTRSAIGTLVERTKLLHLPNGRTAEHVRDALIAQLGACRRTWPGQ